MIRGLIEISEFIQIISNCIIGFRDGFSDLRALLNICTFGTSHTEFYTSVLSEIIWCNFFSIAMFRGKNEIILNSRRVV